MIFPPLVLEDHATIQAILNGRLSFARFGDGEYRLVSGGGTKTQPRDPQLTQRLREVLKNPTNHVLVGILDLYSNKPVGTPWPARARTTARYGTEDWARKYLAPTTYGCASVTRLCNWSLGDWHQWRGLVRRLWADKDVLLVTGSEKGLAAEEMVEPLARSCTTLFIHQTTGAWERYPFIFNYCRMWGEGRENGIVLAALGATATVLAHDLGVTGVQCIDIGHMPQSLNGISPKTMPEP